MAYYFQGAGEHLQLFSGIWGASSLFLGFREHCKEKSKKKNLTLKEMPSFRWILFYKSLASGGGGGEDEVVRSLASFSS